jgi:L-histidine N-alpha-methyltransferase
VGFHTVANFLPPSRSPNASPRIEPETLAPQGESVLPIAEAVSTLQSVASAARSGLTASPRTLPPWLFYDEAGSHLFEQITVLPEYYLTRTERAIFAQHATAIVTALGTDITIAELGAGTATKTGLLLRAALTRQPALLYQPIDVSQTCLDEAVTTLEQDIPGLTVSPQLANYTTEPIHLERPAGTKILALYIGSSIGNFSPAEAQSILANLRSQLRPGDALLLGTDLAPSPAKSIESLLAAYDDAAGVTAAFNLNVLTRLNRDLEADFDPTCFRHVARWNPTESRIEMHLESLNRQTIHIPVCDLTITFEKGETIHTENSYKFTHAALTHLFATTGYTPTRTFHDENNLFAVTLATAL